MKLHTMDIPKRSSKQVTHLQNTPKIVLLITLILLLSTVVSLYHPIIPIPLHFFNTFSPKSSSSASDHPAEDSAAGATAGTTKCDLSTGEWVPNPEGPYYTNTTCWAIHEHQNCMKYGRPDTDFMKWRWKPNGCELPLFNPAQFLEILRGKSLAFVGDSVGRNHMQSLICLLSKVTYPEDVSYTANDSFKRWLYKDYNVTVATFWSPFLVKSTEADSNGPTLSGLYNLHLDEFDENWTTQITEFDYVIFSAAHWFFRPAIFYQDGKITGCFYCKLPNITELTQYHGYRMAFRTAFKAINSLVPKFKGTIILRTFSPKHFENGTWNQGGNCIRTRPFYSNETILGGSELEMYLIQVEEFKRAKEVGEKWGLNFMLLDTTQAMLLRPDGHPSIYGHWPQENVTLYYDCVHWCLPGPIDAWNDILLEMIKMNGAGRKVEVK